MRNRNTIEFLGVWGELHNLEFNRVQFVAIKNEVGLNRFVMIPSKWITQMDAIKDNLISPELTPAKIAYTYANEADMLNVVLFGKTAKQWKDLMDRQTV